MNTILIKVNHIGEIRIADELTIQAPIEMIWFPNIDLVLETEHERIVVNSGEDIIITPKAVDKNLTPVKDVDIKLMQNDVSKYLIINEKFAHRLPDAVFRPL